MGIATHHISSLDNLEPISPTNFGSVSKTWNMFFTGCGADYIRKLAAAVPTGKEAVDSELVLIIFTRVHPDYQHYIADLDSGLAVWKKAIKDWVIAGAPKPGRYNDPPPEPAEEIGAHSAMAARSAWLERAFATIMASQSGASPAPDPYEVEAAFKIVHESALPINDADSD